MYLLQSTSSLALKVLRQGSELRLKRGKNKIAKRPSWRVPLIGLVFKNVHVTRTGLDWANASLVQVNLRRNLRPTLTSWTQTGRILQTYLKHLVHSLPSKVCIIIDCTIFRIKTYDINFNWQLQNELKKEPQQEQQNFFFELLEEWGDQLHQRRELSSTL